MFSKTFFALLMIITIAVVPQTHTRAAPLKVLSFFVKDENATVYDDNGSGQPDLMGDTWIYDINGDGQSELIIRFKQEPTLTAYVFDDSDSDGRVDYLVDQEGVTILEPHWRVKVTARENRWLLPDGQPDWNLDLIVDSGFHMASGVPAIQRQTCWSKNQVYTAIALDDKFVNANGRVSTIDGESDFTISNWDLNNDGIPDIEWRNSDGDGTTANMFVNLNPAWRITVTHQFPLLGSVLDMDWAKARIAYIRTLVITYLNKAGYNLTTIRSPQMPGQAAFAHEAPFAYYDLGENSSCLPDLKLRLVSTAPDENNPSIIYYEEARYSWAQTSDQIQYRLYLIGKVSSTESVFYPPYPVSQVTYQDLPAFVVTNIWQGGSFAEYEGTAQNNFPEGIYENISYIPLLRKVVLDHAQISLPDYFPIYLQLREEYNFTDFNASPRLYFSPIDRRLHLMSASRGIIIFSADTSQNTTRFDFTAQELSDGKLHLHSWTAYTDGDGDGYVDTWTYYENGISVTQLVFRNGVTLLADGDSILIKLLPMSIKAADWVAPPPSTQLEWQLYHDRLNPVISRRTLSDLEGIFADLPGQVTVLANTQMLSISAQSQGLIAEIATLDPLLLASPLREQLRAPGNYILRVISGNIQIDQPQPVTLQLSPLTFVPSKSEKSESGIVFNVQNLGLTDVYVHILLQDRIKMSSAILLDENVLIPALGQKDFNVSWLPATPGEHQLEAQLQYNPDNGTSPSTQIRKLTVEDNSPSIRAGVFYLTHSNLTLTLLFSCLLIGLLLGGSIFLYISYSSNDEPRS